MTSGPAGTHDDRKVRAMTTTANRAIATVAVAAAVLIAWVLVIHPAVTAATSAANAARQIPVATAQLAETSQQLAKTTAQLARIAPTIGQVATAFGGTPADTVAAQAKREEPAWFAAWCHRHPQSSIETANSVNGNDGWAIYFAVIDKYANFQSEQDAHAAIRRWCK